MFKIKVALIGLALLLMGSAFPGRGKDQAARAVPIVDITNDCLIGGVADGHWVQAEDMAKQISGGEKYRFYDLAGFVAEGIGEKPDSAGPPCPETMVVKIDPIPQN